MQVKVPGVSRGGKEVVLLLEGTYPYVRGGVSSWVHQIVRGLEEYDFRLIFIGGDRGAYSKMSYELPDNVVGLELHYLADSWNTRKSKPSEGCAAAFATSDNLHAAMKETDQGCPNARLGKLLELISGPDPEISQDDFLFSKASWQSIVGAYEGYCADPSFLNYFWTVRSMHAPVFLLSQIANNLSEPAVIHSISTGYAGLLGAMIKSRYPQAGFVLSEHGIYTKERKIDLSRADWIAEPTGHFDAGLTDDIGYIRKLWIRFYQQVGRMTYEACDPIVSLYGGNRERQIADGAQAQRTRVIPNGISLGQYGQALDKRPAKVPKVVGFIGRVVPIKDVKTFIRAMRTVCTEVPGTEAWLIGPTEEDEDYANECHGLVASLGLEDQVKFLGFQNVPEMLPQIGLMVLTSISEAQPLVMLEAYAAGVPCIATDVGSCREMIEGAPGADAQLGHSGRVTGISDPMATAAACIELFKDEDLWREAQRAGIERVTQFYTEELMFKRYRDVYEEAFSWQA